MKNKQETTKFSKMYNEAHTDKQKRGKDRDKTPKQRKNERKHRRAKIRMKMALYASIVFLAGVTVDHVGQQLLNPPVEGVELDKAKQFRDEQARAAITEGSREKAKEKLESVQEPGDVSKILDDVVEEYWEEYYEEDVDHVSLDKITERIEVYKDTAKNGDEIERYTRREGNRPIDALITAIIYTDEGSYKENLVLEHGSYRIVYNENEKVEKAEESKIKDIAPVILEGLEYKNAMNQNELGKTSDERLREYREDFEEELAKYYDASLEREVFGGQSTQENIVEVENENEP